MADNKVKAGEKKRRPLLLKLISIGDPIPSGLGDTLRSLKRLRSVPRIYKEVEQEAYREDKTLKSFEDYVIEYGLDDAKLRKMQTRFYWVSVIFLCFFFVLSWYSYSLISHSILASISLFFIGMISLLNFALFNLRSFQIKHRNLHDFFIWLSSPQEWLVK